MSSRNQTLRFERAMSPGNFSLSITVLEKWGRPGGFSF
jgi:hypothetical protein